MCFVYAIERGRGEEEKFEYLLENGHADMCSYSQAQGHRRLKMVVVSTDIKPAGRTIPSYCSLSFARKKLSIC